MAVSRAPRPARLRPPSPLESSKTQRAECRRDRQALCIMCPKHRLILLSLRPIDRVPSMMSLKPPSMPLSLHDTSRDLLTLALMGAMISRRICVKSCAGETQWIGSSTGSSPSVSSLGDWVWRPRPGRTLQPVPPGHQDQVASLDPPFTVARTPLPAASRRTSPLVYDATPLRLHAEELLG
jgi:hypothetical protein